MINNLEPGKVCRIYIRPQSPAASEFGNEIDGCIKGRDVISIKQNGSFESLYEGKVNQVNVVILEDTYGTEWKIPEIDIENIVCE